MKAKSVRYGIWFTLFIFMILLKIPYTFANEADYDVEDSPDGSITIKTYTGIGGDMVIPHQIQGKIVTGIDAWVFTNKNLTSLTIPETITTIGAYAFYQNQLTSVTLPSNLTNISDGVFSLNQLTNVILPNNLSSIGNYAFSGNLLESVDIPKSVISIGDHAFSTNDIVNVKIPEGVKIIGSNAFARNDIESLEIPESVKSIGDEAFSNNYLKEIIIYSKDVEIGDDAFIGHSPNLVIYAPENSSAKEYADRLNINFQGINSPDPVNEADYEWTKNRDGSVTIRDYIGTDMAITIPSQLDGRVVTAIGSGAFGEKGLTQVIIPDSVTSIGDVAFAENQLTYVKLPNNLKKIGEGVFFTNKLTAIEIPDQVTQIGSYAFLDNALATVKLPNQLKTIGDFAFMENQLTNIELPATLETIGEWAFSDNHITSLVIPTSVVSIGAYAFATNELSNVTIPSSITSIAESVFLDNQLTSIEIPSSVTNIGRWAFGKNRLSSIEIPKNVMTVEDNAFNDNNLKQVKILSDATILLEDIFNANPSNLIIYGHDASTAQAYANQNNHQFELLTYQIIYHGNGSEQGNPPVDMNMYPRNTPATILDNIGSLEKTGYTFDGWNSTNVGDGIDYTVNSIVDIEESDLALYAKWKANSYVVTFNTNGGTAINPITVIYEALVSKPVIPIKPGYTFLGWYKDAQFTIPWNFTTDMITQNTTLYAKWENVVAQYTVDFETNGGSAVASQKVTKDTLATNPVNPTKAGYTFTGWYKDIELTIPWNFSKDLVKSNITLYAHWVKDGSSGGGGSISPNPSPKPGPNIPEKQEQKPEEQKPEEPKSEEQKPKPEEPIDPQPTEPDIIFSDISQGHWAWAMIQEMAKQGIITGYQDGTFKPNAPIQRQHAALILTRALALEPKKDAREFNDIPKDHLYFGVIDQVQQAGLFEGIDGNFQPTTNLTRAQMAKVLVLAFNLTSSNKDTFEDVPKTHWAHNFIAILAGNGITIGDNGNFRPNDPVTRAEFVTFLYRALHQ
ncbi:leucine-rich repeat protein [Lysinibacillus capsici]|uniref:leucine-rich repeat protein n=1 Tax=Lysinibacillus capsici TaxID=2115968 RepID=UPI0032E04551